MTGGPAPPLDFLLSETINVSLVSTRLGQDFCCLEGEVFCFFLLRINFVLPTETAWTFVLSHVRV